MNSEKCEKKKILKFRYFHDSFLKELYYKESK